VVKRGGGRSSLVLAVVLDLAQVVLGWSELVRLLPVSCCWSRYCAYVWAGYGELIFCKLCTAFGHLGGRVCMFVVIHMWNPMWCNLG